MEFFKVKTKTGFEAEIDKRVTDDFELLEKIDDLETTGSGVPSFAKLLLGANDYKRLKEHCRRKDGKISAKRFENEILDILNSMQTDDGVSVKN